MKKFLMSCAAVALMTGAALAEDAKQSPVPVLQQIIIEEAPVEPAPAAVNEAAALEQKAKNAAAAAAAQPAATLPTVDELAAEAAPPAEAAQLPTVDEIIQEAAPAIAAEQPAPAAEQATPQPETKQAEEPAAAPAEAAPEQKTAEPAPAAPAPEESKQAETTEPVKEEPEKAEAKPKKTAAAPKGPREESPEVRKLNEEQLAKFKQEKAAGQTDEILIRETETSITTGPQDMPGMNRVNFMDFDLNQDGVLSQSEVGEKLYRLFDLDGNQVIDNKEMETISVLTIIPMEKETIEVENYPLTGEEKVSISTEEFMKTSKLIAYDKQKDGLTPLDFLGKKFNQVDVKNDKVIDLEEWKRAYEELTKKPHEESFRYNG